MDGAYGFFTGLSKSFGLFYFIGFSICVVVYACWPANKKQFDQAAHDILEDEDRPWHC